MLFRYLRKHLVLTGFSWCIGLYFCVIKLPASTVRLKFFRKKQKDTWLNASIECKKSENPLIFALFKILGFGNYFVCSKAKVWVVTSQTFDGPKYWIAPGKRYTSSIAHFSLLAASLPKTGPSMSTSAFLITGLNSP